jgi:hypothetical protein
LAVAEGDTTGLTIFDVQREVGEVLEDERFFGYWGTDPGIA